MALNYDSFLIARETIMSKVSIPDYYLDYIDETVNLDRYNKDCCPLHDEDTPSFFYFENTGTFHCFGCGKTGGVVELHYHIQRRLNNDYKKSKAVLDLAKMYNIDIPNLFENPKLNDVKKFNSFKKLEFKPKEKLVKPKKKIEYDMEKKIMNLKRSVDTDFFEEILSEFDEIFFRNGDVENQLKVLNKKINTYLMRGGN